MPRPSVEAERRDQLLRATCQVIAESGVRDLRMSDVAGRAGVSTGTVHYYFDSKQDLIHAAFEDNFRSSLDRRAAVLQSGDDPLTLLERVIGSYAPTDQESIAAWRVWAELWVHALQEPELRALNETLYGDWRRMIVDLVRAAQDDGQLGDGDPVEIANSVIAMIDGLAIQVLLGSKDMTGERMRATCRAYLRGLTVSRGLTGARPPWR